MKIHSSSKSNQDQVWNSILITEETNRNLTNKNHSIGSIHSCFLFVGEKGADMSQPTVDKSHIPSNVYGKIHIESGALKPVQFV